jgi:isopentenyl-diphosphate delta-isomerase
MSKDRKADHVEICLTKQVSASYNFWDDVHLIHNALPELSFEEIDTSTELFGKKLKAPLLIAAMTGGFKTDKYDAEVINGNLAAAAAETGIGMGVGSQRMAISDSEYESTYSVVKQYKVPLVIGNIGAPQLLDQNDSKKSLGLADLKKAVELIDADAVALHLNYLQEVAMVNGDLNSKGCLEAISALTKDVPIIAKETGAGISKDTAVKLKDAGAAGIDCGGLSGTSFAAVEKYRADMAGDKLHSRAGETFWNWGIPAPISVLEAQVGLPLIATGGIRTGLDAARAVVLGANCAGTARSLLAAAVESSDAVAELLKIIIYELKSSMFLTGAQNIGELSKQKYILTGPSREWVAQLK